MKTKPPLPPPTFTTTTPWNPADPLGSLVVLYAVAPADTYGPWPSPPSQPVVPAPAIGLPGVIEPSLAKRLSDLEAKVDHALALLEQVLAGLKVREVAEEMLRQIGKRRP